MHTKLGPLRHCGYESAGAASSSHRDPALVAPSPRPRRNNRQGPSGQISAGRATLFARFVVSLNIFNLALIFIGVLSSRHHRATPALFLSFSLVRFFSCLLIFLLSLTNISDTFSLATFTTSTATARSLLRGLNCSRLILFIFLMDNNFILFDIFFFSSLIQVDV